MTDEEPNSLCQDFYTFLSGGSDFLGRLKFPQQATISNLCVGVCAELALCLANYVLALEPSPRPWPLPPSSQQTALHSTTLSECLSHYHSWLAHSEKREGRKKPKQKYTVFFSFSALPWKAIHPCKILTFSSAVLVSQRFALISRIFKHPAAYHYDSVIKGINSCEHVPELQVNFNVGWRSIQNKMMMQLDVAIISWWRTSAGLRKPIKRQVINARKAI